MKKSTRLLAVLLIVMLAINVLAYAADSSKCISLDALNSENYFALQSSAVLLAQNANYVIGMGRVGEEAQLCSLHYLPGEQNSTLVANVPQNSYVKVYDGQYSDTDSNIWMKVEFEGQTGYMLLSTLILCSCENVGSDLASHTDSCSDKSYVSYICQTMSAQELYEQYLSLPTHIAEFILIRLSWGLQEKLDELQALIDMPRIDCICGINEQDPTLHAGDCDYYLNCLGICDSTAEEIYAQWEGLAEVVRTFVLAQLQQTYEEKFIELQVLLGVLRKADVIAGETTVTLLGAIPENAEIIAEIKDSPEEVNGEALFTIDITILCDGAAWQPAEGESVRITLDAASLNLEESTMVDMLHWCVDETGAKFAEDIGTTSVVEGMLSFTTTGFSEFTGVKNNSENYWKNDEYIFLDLAKGTIDITDNFILQKNSNDGDVVNLTGDDVNKKIYIFQSNEDQDINASWDEDNKTLITPNYDRVPGWADIINNNDNVLDVVAAWDISAGGVGRAGTPHYINIKGSTQKDITLENVWSTNSARIQNGTERGGLNINAASGCVVNLHFVGDNRMAAVHINSSTEAVYFNGAADATLTVAAFTDGNNFWNSAIGNNDSHDSVKGIIINSGNIFAGTTNYDNSTAIGAGGNGRGVVTINGGIVTAVAATSGTAIGGGIGYHAAGGSANVTINGGEVYAYNHGVCLDNTRDNTEKYYIVTAAAIGGGSSIEAAGSSDTSVRITGGKVRAYSVGGAGIGGGGSVANNGGGITVYISNDADVIALSLGKEEVAAGGKQYGNKPASITATAYPGTSIGGGTGRQLGGTATVNISGSPTIYTGSIGGGQCLDTTNGKIGAANVIISGGTTHGQVVMAKGATTNCSFKMDGGIIDNTYDEDKGTAYFIRNNGGAVYVENGKAELKAGTVRNSNANNGGAFYVTGGAFEMTGGAIENCHATAEEGIGGAVCVVSGTVEIKGGTIDGGVHDNAVNNAAYGGAVGISGGDFTMEQGTIQRSLAENGGGIYIVGGTCTMHGGTVEANIAHANGGAVYVKDTSVDFVNTTNVELIVRRNKADSGGGFYVEQTADEHIIAVSNGKITGNTASVNGGGIAVNATGGKVQIKVTGGNIRENTASANGGGIAVESTNGAAQIDMEGGFIRENIANNGAGIYVMKGAGTGSANMSVNGGQIIENKAMNCGGGIYQSGYGSGITVSGDTATIQGNIASNGGGIYLIDDASLIVSGGSITSNKAVVAPASYVATAAWTDTPADYRPGSGTKTAYHKDDEKGVGGGVSLAKGASATQFKLDADGHSVGIYGNLAQYAADDVFASGEGTKLNLPLKKDMVILGGLQDVQGWFEDYAPGDAEYENGLNGNPQPALKEVGRYRTAEDTFFAYPYDDPNTDADDSSKYMNTKDMYVCATLGVKRSGSGTLIIQKVIDGESDTNQIFLFDIDGSAVDLQAALEKGKKVTITALPNGQYTVSENNVWSWRYQMQSIEVKVTKTGADGNPVTTTTTYDETSNPFVNNGVEITLDTETSEVEIIFTNKKTDGKWLDQDIGRAINEYGVINQPEQPDQPGTDDETGGSEND